MGPRAPARTALLDYQNLGGWDSMGLAALIGMVTPLNVLIGYDCSVHMCRSQQRFRRIILSDQQLTSRVYS